MTTTSPALSFTKAESEDAHQKWGANCGPHALAASCGISILQAVEAIPDFLKKRYTNPTMMEGGLRTLGRRYVRTRDLRVKTVPTHGVARIQWEGKWLRSGVPPVVAYAYTHWVASHGDHVFCPAAPITNHFGWLPFEEWRHAMDYLCAMSRYDGWHVTHQYLLL